MEVLDEQIKNIFKNKMAQQQKKRRARNIAKQKDKDLQDTLEKLQTLQESTMQQNAMVHNLTAVTHGESIENLDQVAPYLDGSVEETLKLIPTFGETPQKNPGNLVNV